MHPVALVGRARVGVALAIDLAKNSYVSPIVGATPTPTLPTRGREKKRLNHRTVGLTRLPMDVVLHRGGCIGW